VLEECVAGLAPGGRVPENHVLVLQALAVDQGFELEWVLFARVPANGCELDALCRIPRDHRGSRRTVGLAQFVAVATILRARQRAPTPVDMDALGAPGHRRDCAGA